jgi:hypothetical protein
MATAAARALWRSGDGVTKYFMIGGALGTVTGVATGVAMVLDGDQAFAGAAGALWVGGATTLFWPLGVAGWVLYVPLKGVELLRKQKKNAIP